MCSLCHMTKHFLTEMRYGGMSVVAVAVAVAVAVEAAPRIAAVAAAAATAAAEAVAAISVLPQAHCCVFPVSPVWGREPPAPWSQRQQPKKACPRKKRGSRITQGAAWDSGSFDICHAEHDEISCGPHQEQEWARSAGSAGGFGGLPGPVVSREERVFERFREVGQGQAEKFCVCVGIQAGDLGDTHRRAWSC